MGKRGKVIGAVLIIALIVSGAFAVDRARAAERYRSRLREMYDGALLTSLTRIEDMQIKLSKALLSGAESDGYAYLTSVVGGAESVKQNLSLLPLSHAATQRALKFANQIGDWAQALMASSHGGLSPSDHHTIDSLIDACAQLSSALTAAREDIASAALTTENVFWLSDEQARADGGALGDADIDYPRLIYDGPFSDDIAAGTPKALKSNLVTREQAEALARRYVGESRVTSVSRGADMGGVIDAYGVTVATGDVTLEVAVSKQGGHLVWMSPDSAGFPVSRGIDECRAAALQYLEENGFDDMEACHFQVYDGVAVINFAATQGGVLLYPDMVKTQVRMDTAQVVGVEASHYLMNHAPRPHLTPEISVEDARKSLSELVTVEGSRLCVIPLGADEAFCHEFSCRYKDDVYLIYVDAATGARREILKVVETNEGLLTV